MNFNFPGWNHLNNASVFSNERQYNKKRTVGNFANVSVAWKNMLYLSGSIRNDIVSSMPPNDFAGSLLTFVGYFDSGTFNIKTGKVECGDESVTTYYFGDPQSDHMEY